MFRKSLTIMGAALLLTLTFAATQAKADGVRFRFTGGHWSRSSHSGWHRYWGGPTIGFYFAPEPVYIVDGYDDPSYYSGPDFWYSDPSFGLEINIGGGGGYRYNDDRSYRDRYDGRSDYRGGRNGYRDSGSRYDGGGSSFNSRDRGYSGGGSGYHSGDYRNRGGGTDFNSRDHGYGGSGSSGSGTGYSRGHGSDGSSYSGGGTGYSRDHGTGSGSFSGGSHGSGGNSYSGSHGYSNGGSGGTSRSYSGGGRSNGRDGR